jgi:transcriptional regulator with XRE-family HTH domain
MRTAFVANELRPARIRDFREQAGFTEAELAHRIGLREADVHAIEAGEAGITTDALLALSEESDLGISHFMNEWAHWPVLDAHFKAGHELERPLRADFVRDLHHALDHGHLTARKAASSLQMTLYELAKVFPAYGLEEPFHL